MADNDYWGNILVIRTMFALFSTLKAFTFKNLKGKYHSKELLEILLIFGGLLLLVTPWLARHFWQPRPGRELPFGAKDLSPAFSSLPLQIIIPDVSIDLPVKEANVEGNNWELFEDAASHLITSAKVGQQGNTVIYAHAKPYLFEPLKKVKKGGRIYILIDNGWAVYEVFKTETVPPAKIEVVFPTEEKTLTLYTCTNFLDKDRFVVSAKLVDSGQEATP